MTLATIFLSETVGTAMLLLLGAGVVANNILPKNKGEGTGFLMVNFGWGLAVFAGVLVSYKSGAFLGAVLAWLAYKKQFDGDAPEGFKLGVFSTGPEVRDTVWNLVTEAVATFVLVFVVLAAGHWGDSATKTPAGLGWLGALGVALLVVGIGASLGGPTGYAINPARDLGPRIAHAVLPIPNKGSSDWGYSWIPVVGPIIGGVAAGLLSHSLLP